MRLDAQALETSFDLIAPRGDDFVGGRDDASRRRAMPDAA
jgi:hypothetical protein